jgi:hypothetical protein
LNRVAIPTDGSESGAQQDHGLECDGLRVYFKNLAPRLIEHISRADCVLGCVAWLTHEDVLRALVGRDVAIVVQKEDFLRPDGVAAGDWSAELRRRYSRLACTLDRRQLPGIACELSTGGDVTVAPVRCVGNHNADRHPAFPRMHHKFALFARKRPQRTDPDTGGTWTWPIYPYAVWAGSFNWTNTAARSFENAIYTELPAVVDAFAREWAQVFALSEPLDWQSRWAEPEYRIGT